MGYLQLNRRDPRGYKESRTEATPPLFVGEMKQPNPILFVGRRYAPVHRMDHYEIGEGRRSDHLSRQVLVCACGVTDPDVDQLGLYKWQP